MVSRRQFLKCGGAAVASVLSGSVPSMISDSEPPRMHVVYRGNAHDLYSMAALAYLEGDNTALRYINPLIEEVESASNLSAEVREIEEYLAETSLFYSKEFHMSPVSKEDPECARRANIVSAALKPKIIAHSAKIADATNFRIYSKDGSLFLSVNGAETEIHDLCLDTLAKYDGDREKLKASKSSSSPVKRIAHTISNAARDMGVIYNASRRGDTPLTVMLSIASIESVGQRYAVGSCVGEIGRFQITRSTAERLRRRYPERFDYSPDELLGRLVRDPRLNAEFAVLSLNDNALNLPYPEKSAIFNMGAGNVSKLGFEMLRDLKYVQDFMVYHDVLEKKRYLF